MFKEQIAVAKSLGLLNNVYMIIENMLCLDMKTIIDDFCNPGIFIHVKTSFRCPNNNQHLLHFHRILPLQHLEERASYTLEPQHLGEIIPPLPFTFDSSVEAHRRAGIVD